MEWMVRARAGPALRRLLLECLFVDREHREDIFADQSDGDDDAEDDKREDQAILDRRGSGLVTEKRSQRLRQYA